MFFGRLPRPVTEAHRANLEAPCPKPWDTARAAAGFAWNRHNSSDFGRSGTDAKNATLYIAGSGFGPGGQTIPSPTTTKSDAATPPGTTRQQTILLVDDELDILESLKQLFEVSLRGVRVLTAEGGQGGLKILRADQVDLIVTDYKMPGMNGLEFLGEARKILPKVPRILVTAFPDLELAIRAVNDAKIENFFTKPVEPSKVIEIVKALLAERRTQELRDQSFARSLDALRRQVQKE